VLDVLELKPQDANKERVIREGILSWLVPLLRTPVVKVLEQVLMLSWNVSILRNAFWIVSDNEADNKLKMVEKGILPPLIALLSAQEERVQELTCGTIRNLSIHRMLFLALSEAAEDNKVRIVQEGALTPLVALLKSLVVKIVEHAAATLRNLSSRGCLRAPRNLHAQKGMT
jgi:ethanolamine ammonia-lyase large subunit